MDEFIIETEPETENEAALGTIVAEMLTSFSFRGDHGMVAHYIDRLSDAGFSVAVMESLLGK